MPSLGYRDEYTLAPLGKQVDYERPRIEAHLSSTSVSIARWRNGSQITLGHRMLSLNDIGGLILNQGSIENLEPGPACR
jgi:hypothetical protein